MAKQNSDLFIIFILDFLIYKGKSPTKKVFSFVQRMQTYSYVQSAPYFAIDLNLKSVSMEDGVFMFCMSCFKVLYFENYIFIVQKKKEATAELHIFMKCYKFIWFGLIRVFTQMLSCCAI